LDLKDISAHKKEFRKCFENSTQVSAPALKFFLTKPFSHSIMNMKMVFLFLFIFLFIIRRGVWVWIVYALLAAVFAALTSILAKMGLEGVNSNLAVALRTVVVLLFAWGIVFFTGRHNEIADITARSWWFLGLSGLATGLSWLFFFRALQIGEASRVIPVDKFSVVIAMVLAFVVLREAMDVKTIIGGVMITAGTVVLVL
jgi:transporter family protein